MLIKTKKYRLPERVYIQLGMRNVLRQQWWVFLIAFGMLALTFFVKTIWFIILSVVGLLLYALFWFIQFYAVTKVAENRLLFDRLSYEINSQQILVQVDTKHGMPILWEGVKRVWRGKDSFLLVITKTHLIHLPYKIFNSANEIKFFETILKRKRLLP
jgi:hypothetical protein